MRELKQRSNQNRSKRRFNSDGTVISASSREKRLKRRQIVMQQWQSSKCICSPFYDDLFYLISYII